MGLLAERERTRDTLRGARVSFTGRLASITRREAHELVRAAGGTPASTISGRTTFLVIGMHGWPLREDGRVSVKLEQAERMRARRGRLRIISELRFLELAGLRDRGPSVRKTYSLDQVARVVGVDEATVERWEFLGLVRSDEGKYDFQDIVSLQAIAALVQAGVEPVNIRRSLEALASFLPGTDRPLAQLRIVAADSGELAAQIGESLVTPDGQQLLSFTASPEPAEEPSLRDPARPAATAEEIFERAVWLEEMEHYDEAADAYRRAIALEPDRSEAYFNLGNVLRSVGRLDAAAELYRLALGLDPADELAWYNLADLQEELGCFDEAILSLRTAIEIRPSFADGHFNLAGCLEEIGQRDQARAHWQAYLKLDPNSEWADIARRRLQAASPR